ncbi:MAG: hypothetical protein ACLR5S_01285 [Ruminococcus sp.]
MAGKSKNRKRWDAVTTVAYPLLFAVLLIAAWQTKLLHRLLHVDTFILPIPTRILTIIQENWAHCREFPVHRDRYCGSAFAVPLAAGV